MPFGRSSPAGIALNVALSILVISMSLVITSCRSQPDIMPPLLKAGSGEQISFAVGPFADLRRLGSTGDQAWGWGDLADGRQVYFTLSTDGALAAAEIHEIDGQELSYLTPVVGGLVALREPETTAWYCRIGGEPASLGPAEGLKVSPTGRRVLTFSPEGSACFDIPSLSRVSQPSYPVYDHPYRGQHHAWIGDDMVVVRYGEPGGGPEGLAHDTCVLKMVSIAEGSELATLRADGHILSPFPSPDGRWLAVLHIDGDEFELEPNGIIPPDLGREVRIYSQASLLSADLTPEAVIRPQAGNWIYGLRWAGDGSKLAYLETEVTASGRVTGAATVMLAKAPGFGSEDVGLPNGPWSIGAFAPEGNPLWVLDRSDTGRDSFIYDATTGAVARLAEKPLRADWVGNDRMVVLTREAVLPGTDRAVPAVVDAATGEMIASGWPAASLSWLKAVGDSHYVFSVIADSADALTGFSGGAAGEWLVLGAVGSEP